MHRERIGQGHGAYLIGAANGAGASIVATQTAEIISRWAPIPSMTKLGIQLVTEGTRRSFAGNGTTDNVAAGPTWTLANGAFVAGDVGGTLIVRGTVSNDGWYTIATRASATSITTSATPAITAETFPVGATFTVIPPGGIDGNWIIRVSNDYTDGRPFGALAAVGSEQVTTEANAHITDITSLFANPSIATVAHGTAATRNQFVIMPPSAVARMFQVAFRPVATTGAGLAFAILNGVS